MSELDAVVDEVDSAVYEPLQRLLFPKTSDMFLTAVVERFASDARADIITLGLDDVNDLFDRHGLSCCALAGINSDIYGTTGEQSERQSHTLDDNESRQTKEAQIAEATDFSLTLLLSSPGIKLAKRQIQNSVSKKTPLILYLPKVKSLLDVYASTFLEALLDALRGITSNGLIISTSTEYERRSQKDRRGSRLSNARILRVIGLDHGMDVIRMVPVCSHTRRLLFDEHRKLEDSYEQQNVRLLQQSTRHLPVELHRSPIVLPYADWGFLKGTAAHEQLVKYARDAIHEIENDDAFEWERRFLDVLINPDDVEEGWSAIALEPDIKEAIQQLIHQPTNTGIHSYGILKRGRIGGALLYGPPGTGKTQLARVLARESKAITICASAADIDFSYVGETEKAIKGLFNLALMLSPCTIFLDEADALFLSRKSNDKSWERSQINHLLHEMDGLKKSRCPPFILLATNFPNDLDSAVLRRVSSRIHIGLPSPEARQQIFQIYLADEMLHPDVNLCHLAERSQGYSSSDIQTVCVQAALICDTFIGDDARRYITNAQFDKAFQRSAPTVSKGALAQIEAFSKEYNPAALESIEQTGKVGQAPNGTSYL
ncbi:MAG: hypothetical protein Q9173_002642 [Seirophora scorigena]